MNIIFCNKKAKSTAHNRSVTVRRLSAARLRRNVMWNCWI